MREEKGRGRSCGDPRVDFRKRARILGQTRLDFHLWDGREGAAVGNECAMSYSSFVGQMKHGITDGQNRHSAYM